MSIEKILVLGMGGVGSLVATLLHDNGLQVTGADRIKTAFTPEKIAFVETDINQVDTLNKLFAQHDAVVSCLPWNLTLPVAQAAYKAGIHYFDPTEDVTTTNAIRQMAKDSRGVMIPQNGLAPGFIGILGSAIAHQFDATGLRHIKLRVGALPQHPIGQLGYAGNWSLEGLVHECIAPCDAIIEGTRQKIPALKNIETIRINGIEYEAFTTSGGLGTMTETFEGKVETLNYKSIRYPGHFTGMNLLINELRFRESPDELVKRLAWALPPDDQDRVLIHASVQGNINDRLQTKEIVADYLPIELCGKRRTSIIWTTACAIVGVIDMVRQGHLPQQGFVKQEDINLNLFLQTKSGKNYLTQHPELLSSFL